MAARCSFALVAWRAVGMMSNRTEQRKKRRSLTSASGDRSPAGRVDATNYLVDSVNWSHSDWANLATVSFVSGVCCVSHQPQRPEWYQGSKMMTAGKTACSIPLLIVGQSVFYRNPLYYMHRSWSATRSQLRAACFSRKGCLFLSGRCSWLSEYTETAIGLYTMPSVYFRLCWCSFTSRCTCKAN